MRTKAQRSRFSFARHFDVPHDYIARHRRSRKITSIILVAILSLAVAALIVYTSNPGGFAASGDSPLPHSQK